MKNFEHLIHFDISNITIYKENLTKWLLLTDKTGYRDADASKYFMELANFLTLCQDFT